MLFLSHFIVHPLIGLDIHPDEVRLVQLKQTRRGMSVEKFAIEALSPCAMVDGRLKDTADIQLAISRLVKQTHTEGYAAAIALPANSVITKRIQLAANLTEDECEAEITMNLTTYFPGIKEALCLDFAIVDSSHEYHDILLVAARLDQLNEYVQVVTQAGLQVKKVDVDSMTLSRAISRLPSSQANNAILDLGTSIVRLMIFQQHDTLFIQQFVITDPNNRQHELIPQLKLAMQLFFSMHRHVAMKLLILIGNRELWREIAVAIEKECAIKTEWVNPFSTVILSSELDTSLASRLLISYELALSDMSC